MSAEVLAWPSVRKFYPHRVMSPRAVEPATPDQLDQVDSPEDLRCYLRLAVLGWGEYIDSLERRDGDDPNERPWAEQSGRTHGEDGTGQAA
jgi:hypothetical protein